MGIYYKIVCDDFKECLEPSAPKFPAFCMPGSDFGNIVLFTMATRWYGCEVNLVSDIYDFYYTCNYKDITEEIILEMKECKVWPEDDKT